VIHNPLFALPGQPGRRAESVACQREDPELWFSQLPSHLELAKAHCRQCPLQPACLAGAIERAEPWGVWGGEIFDNGVIVAKKRGRGRPRKEAQAA
jgi:WhiB family transcriptional regulator, redox-sensing transcriptional regulator